jgi:hypothetical protein
MTALLDPLTAEKLAKVCGMFGSTQDGERASAAAAADRIIRASGLSWLDFFQGGIRREPESLSELEAWLLSHRDLLSVWEVGFLSTLGSSLSPKQRDRLDEITRKVRAKTESRI